MSELSPETEDLLARGREGAPLSNTRRDELKGAVLAKIALGAGVAGSALTTTSAAAWTAMTKMIGVAVLAVVVGTGAVGVVKYQQHERQSKLAAAQPLMNSTTDAPPSSSANHSVNQADLATLTTSATTIAANQPPSSPENNSQPSLPATAPRTSETSSPSMPPSSPRAANGRNDSSAPPTSAADVATTSAPAVGSANAPSVAGNSRAAANSAVNGSSPNVGSTSGTNAAPLAAPRSSSLEEETALLRAAHEALDGGDPARALSLLDQHAARFPASALEPERSAERVFAFCAEGKIADAQAAATSFIAAHPSGPLAARVGASCGGH